MGVANHVFPELGVHRASKPATLCFEDLHTTAHDKATKAMMVWGKFEFQNKIQNSEI